MSIKKLKISGTVQGVGFRPFVYRKAKQLNLEGWVRNTEEGVEVKIKGNPKNIDRFIEDVKNNPLGAANVTSVKESNEQDRGEKDFVIESSKKKKKKNLNIPPDISICDECLKDISNPDSRRYQYPFTTCLNCGQRFTITKNIPYDRENVTMREFEMCSQCMEEYNNPEDRRFHAQPISCEICGPRYYYKSLKGRKALKKAADDVKNGEVIAVKGWGGFHIMADAENVNVLKEIRKIKKRPHKPIAVMAKDIKTAENYCMIKIEDLNTLNSFRKPIVLLPKRKRNKVTELIAPENMCIGIMLGYSALHYILFELSGVDLMVATSLNAPSQPTIIESDEAKKYFTGSVLDHDLKISMRCDDSVIKSSLSDKIVLRRSRGFVPEGIDIPYGGVALTSGGNENVSFCFTKDKKAYPSQYIGDIEEFDTQKAYKKDILKWKNIWNYKPDILGCDLHPGFESTKIFEQYSRDKKIPLIKTQHHHAHLAGCAAENRLKPEIMGVAFDGTGYSESGQIWGGEFMIFDYKKYRRVGNLRPYPLPGGDMAAKEPWRMAVSYIVESGEDWEELKIDHNKNKWNSVRKLVDKRVNSPRSPSAGRFFDAVSSILNLAHENTFSARAPIALENKVRKKYLKEGYRFKIKSNKERFVMDTANVIKEILKDIKNNISIEIIASKFHYTVAEIAVEGLDRMKKRTGIKKACVTGGVFCNYYITDLVKEMAKKKGINVFTHKKVSPNDNGLSYGQAVICLANLGG